jgi:hypothetical protein
MADPNVGIYCKNANIQAYAGIKANATAKAVAATDVYVLDVESVINAVTHRNWSTAYATLNSNVKYILMQTAAVRCAMIVIMNDLSGFTSRSEAETMLDVLRDIYVMNIEILKDIKNQEFVVGA